MIFFFYIFLSFSAFKCSPDFTDVEWIEVLDGAVPLDQDQEKKLSHDDHILNSDEHESDNDFETFFNCDLVNSLIDDEKGRESQSLSSSECMLISGSVERTPIMLLNDFMFHDSTVNYEVLSDVLSRVNGSIPKRKNRLLRVKSRYKQEYIDMKNNLRRKIAEQLPNYQMGSLRDYEIQNWPEGVDPMAQYWTKAEIEKIKCKFDDLIFNYRPASGGKRQMIKENDFKASDSEFAVILRRFQVESGLYNAKVIEWDMLDRSQLPEEYKDIKTNINIINTAMTKGFLENLHFYRYASFYLPRLIQQNSAHDYCISCREALLEKFKRESRHENAKHIEWSRINLSRLPAKFSHMKLSNATVFDGGLFKDPEFFENVYFDEYCDKELKILAQRTEYRKRRKIIKEMSEI